MKKLLATILGVAVLSITVAACGVDDGSDDYHYHKPKATATATVHHYHYVKPKASKTPSKKATPKPVKTYKSSKKKR